jgi:hypothetical protein
VHGDSDGNTAPAAPPPGSLAWRLRVYPAVILAVLAAVVVLLAVTADDGAALSGRLGGDYPAFYGAGRIAADGDWSHLYEASRQQQAQGTLVDGSGGYLYFAYPPFVAAGYRVLAAVDYRWSYLLHTALMAAALWGAVVLWRRYLPFPVGTAAAVTAALLFYPVLRAVPGGQNTALTMLLVAAAARLDGDGHDVAAGLAVALLLAKPQFGVPMLALLVVGRRWRMVAAGVGGAGVLYLAGAALAGFGWVGEWWSRANAFLDVDAGVNHANLISWQGFVEHLAGTGSTAGVVVGWGLALLTAAFAALFWLRHPHDSPAVRYSVAVAAIVLAAPHTMYYDGGVLLFPLVLLAAAAGRTGWMVAAALWAVSWGQLAADTLGWSPVFLVAVVVGGWAVLRWELPRRAAVPVAPSGATSV